MYGKIDRYILIAILIIGAICLYFLFMNHKGNTGRDSLLIAMAEKLNAGAPLEEEEIENKPKTKIKQSNKPTEEEEFQITAIADKLCFSKPLDQEELEFQKRFPKEIQEELEVSQKTLSVLIHKFSNGVKEFEAKEQEFYEFNQEEIDQIVQNQKLFNSIITKLTAGISDFTEQELQFQQIYGAHIEAELAKIKQASAPSNTYNSQELKGANPPTAADERLKLILSFFEDGIPKTVTDLANKYAEVTKTKAHTSTCSDTLGKLVDEGKLMCAKPIGRKVYHGLPTWFDGKKLKPEYEKHIPK